MENNYDPKNVQKYFGKTFVTESGSQYGLTKDGKFTGRPSIEGAEVMMIAGVENEHYYDISDCLDTLIPEFKAKLDDLILKYGKEMQPGLRLVVSLTSEYVSKKDRYGMITSPIKDII